MDLYWWHCQVVDDNIALCLQNGPEGWLACLPGCCVFGVDPVDFYLAGIGRNGHLVFLDMDDLCRIGD